MKSLELQRVEVIALLALLVAGFTACYSGETLEQLPQDIRVSEELVDFGVVPTGSSVTRLLRVHNSGDYDLEFSQVPAVIHETGHDVFHMEASWVPQPGEDGSEIVRIPPRSYEEMVITFSPVAAEDSYGYVGLYTNDVDEANRFVVLQGSSTVGTPMAQVTPSLVEFGFVASGNVAEEVVEIVNVGDVELDVVSVTVGGSNSPFEVVSVPDFPIPAGSRALVPVRFTSEGGDHQVASLAVEIVGELNTQYVINLSANSPGSNNNSPPQIDLLDPLEPTLFYLHEDLQLLARAFDAQQPNIGLYCTLESSRLGMVEQETSNPVSSEVSFVVDIDNSDFETETGVHTLTLCCTDVFNTTSCITTVVTIDEPFSVGDLDGDGYAPAGGDCDDQDASIYPFAIELADGLDNDCDGIADEDTVNSDDDLDGHSEVLGDCNDGDALIYPGAVEEPDFLDNDCDGTIDEGTDYFDDDLDGYSEALGDCDDGDPDVHRDGLEWCDAKDNDCDGDTDEDCIDDTPPLFLVGGIQADVVVAEFGDEVELCLTVISGPDAELVYDWQAECGSFEGETAGPCVTWVAPSEDTACTVWCQVIDVTSDLSAWGFLEINLERYLDGPRPAANCSTDAEQHADPLLAVLLGLVAGMMGLRGRSRRSRAG